MSDTLSVWNVITPNGTVTFLDEEKALAWVGKNPEMLVVEQAVTRDQYAIIQRWEGSSTQTFDFGAAYYESDGVEEIDITITAAVTVAIKDGEPRARELLKGLSAEIGGECVKWDNE